MRSHTSAEYDLVIAGSGPAGMSAAIYAGRAGLKVCVLEKEAPGGKVIKTDEIENYPGFINIKGPDLAMKFYEQAMNMGVDYEYSGVEHFHKDGEVFEIKCGSGRVLTSKVFIIATGTKENPLGVDGEDRLYGKGVSYCAVCDAAFYKEKEVAVVGGGYSAVEEAGFLTRFASKVYLIHRRQGFRADSKTLAKAENNPKIEFILDTVVEKINGNDKVESIDIKNVVSGETKTLEISAIFPFIGQSPITQFITQNEILDENRNIITNEKMETKIPGLFAAGDVRVTALRQVATAVSDGAVAGQNSVDYIEKLD